MAVLGKGSAHGACSLLHAAALGYGANIALDLSITVRLLDRPSKREVVDDDGVLQALMAAWTGAGHPLPEGFELDELHWGVVSKIPKAQGLKSSAAMCIAALRALCNATETELTPEAMVALAADAQTNAGVSLTGSIDDAWACMTPGWKLVDVQAPIEEGVLMDEPGLPEDEWVVLLVLRGPREVRPTLEDFASQVTASTGPRRPAGPKSTGGVDVERSWDRCCSAGHRGSKNDQRFLHEQRQSRRHHRVRACLGDRGTSKRKTDH